MTLTGHAPRCGRAPRSRRPHRRPRTRRSPSRHARNQRQSMGRRWIAIRFSLASSVISSPGSTAYTSTVAVRGREQFGLPRGGRACRQQRRRACPRAHRTPAGARSAAMRGGRASTGVRVFHVRSSSIRAGTSRNSFPARQRLCRSPRRPLRAFDAMGLADNAEAHGRSRRRSPGPALDETVRRTAGQHQASLGRAKLRQLEHRLGGIPSRRRLRRPEEQRALKPSVAKGPPRDRSPRFRSMNSARSPPIKRAARSRQRFGSSLVASSVPIAAGERDAGPTRCLPAARMVCESARSHDRRIRSARWRPGLPSPRAGRSKDRCAVRPSRRARAVDAVSAVQWIGTNSEPRLLAFAQAHAEDAFAVRALHLRENPSDRRTARRRDVSRRRAPACAGRGAGSGPNASSYAIGRATRPVLSTNG